MEAAELVQSTNNAEVQGGVAFQEVLHQHVRCRRCPDLHHDGWDFPPRLD